MNLAKLSIKRPTFITSLIVVMLIIGFIFMKRMSVDMFPDVNFPFVMITTVYPGAGPEEIERLVSKPLEEEISSISGLKNVYSMSQDGVSLVYGEFTLETDPQYAEEQVKAKVSQIRGNLPDEVKEPVIRRYDPSDSPIMMFTLHGKLSDTALYDFADTVIKDKLSQVKNVSNVQILGGKKREIHINLDYSKLKEYETSVVMISNRIGTNSENIPIGKVSEAKSELTFRSLGEFESIDKIKDVVINFYGSDVPVTLAQVGTVEDSFEEQKTKAYINSKPCLLINVYKQSGSNTVAIADELIKRLDKINKEIKSYPGEPELSMVRDLARPIRMNIIDVTQTILEGIFLAIIVVYLFLGNFRSTFITVVSLPNSLIGAFIFMGLFNFSINVLTLMALSLAVGLLIDDAIVVRENIFRHIEKGETPEIAAQKGTDEVTLPVIATTLAVIAVFLPVGFLQGMVGQFFKEFGLTIVFAMTISLFDALTTAPMLSAYMIGKLEEKNPKGFKAILRMPVNTFEKLYKGVENFYEKTIRFTLQHKGLIIIGAIVIFISSLVLVKGIPKTFMPQGERGEFTMSVEAKPGTSLTQMEKYSLDIEKLVREEKDIELVLTSVGNENGESNIASYYIKMVPAKQRKRLTSDMKEYIRKKLQSYNKDLIIEVNDISIGGDDKPFQVLLKGMDLELLGKTSEMLIEKFKNIPGIVDLNTDYKRGKPEFQVKIDPLRSKEMGVQSTLVGAELRAMVEGTTPAKYRESGFEYDIRVKLQDDQRDLSKRFSSIYIPNMNNQLVKLSTIADPVSTTGPSKINRKNKTRYVSITANLSKNGAIGDVTTTAKQILKNTQLPQGISYEFAGDSEDMVDLFKNMLIAAALSVIFIYLVLASLYESVLIPFTIMLALPLAIVGGLLALFITHKAISMFTMIGFIMLLGIVTKNSILLVDYIKRLIKDGLSMNEAIVRAGVIRLRPILMTTFALIAGMLPLALGLTEVGKFRSSMGIAIIGGLISSTILTLVVIPAVFGFMESFRLYMRKKFGRPNN
jgi:hydrophobic/amphiphilic exporter-1 (mainly G- bacteria), HAE1 family